MSPKPDRDAAMDRLLERTLRGGRPTRGGAACLDAEEAAAFVEGGLSAAERERLELHVADCSRCQGILATIVRSTPAASGAAAAVTRARWTTWTIPLAAAAGLVLAVALWSNRTAREVAESTPASSAAPPPARQVDAVAQEQTARSPASPAPLTREKELGQRAEAKPPAMPTGQTAAAPPVGRDQTAAGARASNEARAAAPAEALLASKADLVVTSPDAAVRWRARPAAIERTTDGGATWAASPIAAGLDLTAGSAPSARVCWLAGSGGVVLRTADGLTWQRVVLPEPAAIVGIEAADARVAVVTATDGRAFRTTDGGATWVRQPLQENQAAPFND